MKLLNELPVWFGGKQRKLQLYNGDLSTLSANEFVDLLVVSAFPNDYTPMPGSLIGSLYKKGLSVGELALNKAEDMRKELGCWFSEELSSEVQQQLNIKRILCFEPVAVSQSAVDVTCNIFRCINNFVFDEALNHIALPIVAAGNQKYPFKEMCAALIEAAVFWLKRGLPVDTIKLVHKDQETIDILKDIFEREAAAYVNNEFNSASISTWSTVDETEQYSSMASSIYIPGSTSDAAVAPPPALAPAAGAPAEFTAPVDYVSTNTYDVFISYSHKQKKSADKLVNELRAAKPDIKIFYDDKSIAKGAQWLKQIAEAIDASSKVVVIISPEYTQSKICWDEFQCAKVREYNSDVSLLVTIYLKSHEKLPTIFQLNNWIDCREDDEVKIKAACNEVLKVLA